MKIEFLYFEGCPNSGPTEKLLQQTIKELIIKAKIEYINIQNNDDAEKYRFLGSPSIRINDKDLEIEETENTQYSMRCRIYRMENEQQGLPPKELIIKKLKMNS